MAIPTITLQQYTYVPVQSRARGHVDDIDNVLVVDPPQQRDLPDAADGHPAALALHPHLLHGYDAVAALVTRPVCVSIRGNAVGICAWD